MIKNVKKTWSINVPKQFVMLFCFHVLQEILPDPQSTSYFKVCSYDEGTKPNSFVATIRMPISTKEEALEWVSQFEKSFKEAVTVC